MVVRHWSGRLWRCWSTEVGAGIEAAQRSHVRWLRALPGSQRRAWACGRRAAAALPGTQLLLNRPCLQVPTGIFDTKVSIMVPDVPFGLKVRRSLRTEWAAAAQLLAFCLALPPHLTGPLQGTCTPRNAMAPLLPQCCEQPQHGCAPVSIDLPLQDPFKGLRPERLPNGSWPWEVLEAEFGTARRFNEEVEEHVRGRCRYAAAFPGSLMLRLPQQLLLLVVVMVLRVGMHAAAAASLLQPLPKPLLEAAHSFQLIGSWMIPSAQVRKGIALPIGDEDWLNPETLAQLSLTGLRQVCCVRCACCGMLCVAHGGIAAGAARQLDDKYLTPATRCPWCATQYIDLAKAQGLSQEAIVRASEVSGTAVCACRQVLGQPPPEPSWHGSSGLPKRPAFPPPSCRHSPPSRPSSSTELCIPLFYLQNLFPIAYYGLRTSGKLGRWKYLEVGVQPIRSVLVRPLIRLAAGGGCSTG